MSFEPIRRVVFSEAAEARERAVGYTFEAVNMHAAKMA